MHSSLHNKLHSTDTDLEQVIERMVFRENVPEEEATSPALPSANAFEPQTNSNNKTALMLLGSGHTHASAPPHQPPQPQDELTTSKDVDL